MIACQTVRRSATVGVNRPRQSRVQDSPATPSIGSTPGVGLKPVMPVNDAGIRTEPPLSVPSERCTWRRATALAPPPLEPPTLRPWSQGLTVVPNIGLAPVAPSANSCMLFLPMQTAPARFSALTIQASAVAAGASASIAEPQVVRNPARSILSLIENTQP